MHTKLVYTFLVNWFFPNIHLVKRLYCQYRYNYIRSHWTASSLPNRRVCLRNGYALAMLHCMYLRFVVFGQSSLPDCLIGLFLHTSLYALWITLHAIQTGWRTKPKDFVQALHWYWRNQRLFVNKDFSVYSAMMFYISWKMLDKKNSNFDNKKVQGYILLRQKFQGLLVINLAKKTTKWISHPGTYDMKKSCVGPK